ncbi:MAG TPA: hypothetical protein VLK33_08495, partial [Terriglobales bacterium]|nr:hypothetical protein [Terriglobales bacterium]
MLGKPTPKCLLLRSTCKKKKYVLASGPRFSTKCVSPDTLVWTEGGPVPISHMGAASVDGSVPISTRVVSMSKAGDKIQSAEAKYFYNSGEKAAKKITTANGYEVVCSLKHPIWCESDGDIRFRTSSEISSLLDDGKDVWFPMMRGCDLWPSVYKTIEYDWFEGKDRRKFEASNRINAADNGQTVLGLARDSKSAPPTIKKWRSTPFVPKHSKIVLDEEIAYLLGLFIGDGCYSPPVFKLYSCYIATADSEIASFVSDVINRRFSGKVSKRGGYNYAVKSASFRELLRQTGMAPRYSYEKTVPQIIFGSPKSVIAAFIRGLFDTDGMVC